MCGGAGAARRRPGPTLAPPPDDRCPPTGPRGRPRATVGTGCALPKIAALGGCAASRTGPEVSHHLPGPSCTTAQKTRASRQRERLVSQDASQRNLAPAHSDPHDRHRWVTPDSRIPEPRTISFGVSTDPHSGHLCTTVSLTLDLRQSDEATDGIPGEVNSPPSRVPLSAVTQPPWASLGQFRRRSAGQSRCGRRPGRG